MKLNWSFICDEAIVDRNNNWSFINVFNMVPILELGAIIPRLSVIGIFEGTDNEKINISIEIRSPSGLLIHATEGREISFSRIEKNLDIPIIRYYQKRAELIQIDEYGTYNFDIIAAGNLINSIQMFVYKPEWDYLQEHLAE